jgi:hypothetical protein
VRAIHLRVIAGALFIGVALAVLAAASDACTNRRAQISGRVLVSWQKGVGRSRKLIPDNVRAWRALVLAPRRTSGAPHRVRFDAEGAFQTCVDPGSYVLSVAGANTDRAWLLHPRRPLPQAIVLTAGQSTRLDVFIDTGVRGKSSPSHRR